METKKRGKGRPSMPKWIWNLPADTLSYKHKHFLAYIWWCGDRGCRDWNWALAKRFGKSIRTMKRWIKNLDDNHFIFINFRQTKTRTLYRRPYYDSKVWRMHRSDWPNNSQLLLKKNTTISQQNSQAPKRAKSGLH